MGTTPIKGLTDAEKRFVREYVQDFDAKRAADIAGGPSGTKYLARLPVQAEIANQLRPRLAGQGITRDRVLAQLEAIAFGDPREYFDASTGQLKRPSDLSDRAAAGLAGIEVSQTRTRYLGNDKDVHVEEATVKIRRHDAIKALEILARHTGIVGDTGTRTDPTAVSVPTLDPEVIKRLPADTLDRLISALDSIQPDGVQTASSKG